MTRLQQDVCDSKALVQLLENSLLIARNKLAMDETRLAEVARRRKCQDNLEEWEEIYVNQHTPDVPGVSASRPSNQDSDVAIPTDEFTNTVRVAAKASAEAADDTSEKHELWSPVRYSMDITQPPPPSKAPPKHAPTNPPHAPFKAFPVGGGTNKASCAARAETVPKHIGGTPAMPAVQIFMS